MSATLRSTIVAEVTLADGQPSLCVRMACGPIGIPDRVEIELVGGHAPAYPPAKIVLPGNALRGLSRVLATLEEIADQLYAELACSGEGGDL